MHEIERFLTIKAEEMDKEQLPLATFRMVQVLASNLIPQVRKNTNNIKWLRWVVYAITGSILTGVSLIAVKILGG